MDYHVAALKWGPCWNRVIGHATRVVNNERELFAAGSTLAAVGYRRRESVVPCGEKCGAVTRTIDLNVGFALQGSRDRICRAAELQPGQRIALEDEISQQAII